MKKNYFFGIALCVLCFGINASTALVSKGISNPRVCVIGAGLAGLTSAKHLQDEGIEFVVFESSRYVGGTWRYDPKVGTDENGLPIHTSMYKHLRTNLPKPTMELKGFPVPEDMASFPTWKTYYNYIQDYTRHFDLEKHIKVLHKVILVSRVANTWKVKYQNVLTNEEFDDEFDFVLVGTGHFSKPNVPNFFGEEKFLGSIIHSHDYREPDRYKNRRVLIVGAGPSGMDITMDVAYVSKTLIHSHHSKVPFRTKFPKHYVKKPDIKEFNETGVIFEDGSYEDVDDVIYCTGYELYYPFLDKSCGLDVTPRSIPHLYKYMVNINQPTMMLLGLVIRGCLVVAIDTQSQYATAVIKGNFKLPSKEQMLEEWESRVNIIKSKGRPLSDIHLLAEKEDEYYADLTKESGIDRVPPVMFNMRIKNMHKMLENLYTFRDYVYTVIDNENFIIHKYNESNHFS